MKTAKKTKLEAAGWKVGSAKELLGLSDAEMALIRIKQSLAQRLRELRTKQAFTQAEVASRIGSSQARVARMEAADASVSVELLMNACLMIGATEKTIGQAITAAPRSTRGPFTKFPG